MKQPAVIFLSAFNRHRCPRLCTMKQLAVIFLLTLGYASKAEAQSFLDTLKSKKAGEGTVTVTQSREIDELVNSAKLMKSVPAADSQQQRTQKDAAGNIAKGKPEQHKNAATGEHSRDMGHGNAADDTADALPTAPSKKVMLNSRKITGYRIQVYSGGNSRADRQKAESTGSAIKMKIPELPVYVHFYSPRWICRVGNFRTYQDADIILKKLKGMGYRQACIVKGKITVGY